MNQSYIIIDPAEGHEELVVQQLQRFEYVIEEVHFIDRGRLMAKVITDNEERFEAFVEEQLETIPGVLGISRLPAAE